MSRTGVLACAGVFVLTALVASEARGGAMQSYTASGNLGLEVVAVSNLPGQLPAMAGTFSLSQMPPGSTIQKAFVYTADWGNSTGLTLNFPNVPFPGDIGAGFFQSDTTTVINQLFAYRWDVTPFVIGAPVSYNFTIGYNPFPPGGTHGNQIGGAALVVVYSNPLSPMTTVSISDGAIQVGENPLALPETESMAFASLPAGETDLFTFTVSDDAAGSNEVVKYNGNTIGGPIDENLGLGSSLLWMKTASQAGNNSVSITSPADHFGWVFSALIVPEPSSVALMSLGLAALAATAWRCRRQRRLR